MDFNPVQEISDSEVVFQIVRGFSEIVQGFSDKVRGFSEIVRGLSEIVRELSDTVWWFHKIVRGLFNLVRGFSNWCLVFWVLFYFPPKRFTPNVINFSHIGSYNYKKESTILKGNTRKREPEIPKIFRRYRAGRNPRTKKPQNFLFSWKTPEFFTVVRGFPSKNDTLYRILFKPSFSYSPPQAPPK